MRANLLKYDLKKMSKPVYEIGAAVRVRDGVCDLDYNNLPLGGWEGRVCEILEDEAEALLYCVEWNAATLKRLRKELPDYFVDAFREELDPFRFNFHAEDIEAGTHAAEDPETPVMQREVEEEFYWSSQGDIGEMVAAALKSFHIENYEDENAYYAGWMRYLEQNLVFPFKAIVYADQLFESDIPDQATVEVIGLVPELDSNFGILAAVNFEGKKHQIPVSDLELPDLEEGEIRYSPMDVYTFWVQNIYEPDFYGDEEEDIEEEPEEEGKA